jgi:hypothetical protein
MQTELEALINSEDAAANGTHRENFRPARGEVLAVSQTLMRVSRKNGCCAN